MQTTHGGPATTSSDTTSSDTGDGKKDDSKKAARQLYRDRRRAFVAGLDAPAREALLRQLAAVCAPLAQLKVARAAPIASYAAVGDEIDPEFVEKAFGPHAFPRIIGDLLHFHVADWADLVPGPLRIPQPLASAPEVQPRLLLVPLIAATLGGVRLGQGGGYYDRTLARLLADADGPVVTVGLAWECQLAEILPRAPHDVLLDWLATPQRLVDCAQNR